MLNIGITSQNLDPNIVVSGISSVVKLIVSKSTNRFFVFEAGYRDNDNKKDYLWLIRQFKMVLKFPFFIISNKINIVHLNIPLSTLGILREFLFLVMAIFFRRKVLSHIHGGPYLMQKGANPLVIFILKKLLKYSTSVIVLSEDEKKSLEYLYGFSGAIVLQNAIDVEYFKNNNNVFKADKLSLLFLARLDFAKGIKEIVEAIECLYKKYRFQMIVCGKGPAESFFIDSCSAIMGNDFTFKGVVSGETKRNVILESDIFLLPSYAEGIPMALLETMAAGVVPIISDDISMKTVVKHGINGLVVEKYNSLDLASKIEYLILEREHGFKLSQAASRTIDEKFNSKNYILKLDEIYNEIRLL